MLKTILAVSLFLVMVGCAENPSRVYFVYETMTGKCFHAQEFQGRTDYWEIDCSKIPDNADLVDVQEWEEGSDVE